MMNYFIFIFFFLISLISTAQECKNLYGTQVLASEEARAHARLLQANAFSIGDNSFDVIHYTCRWAVDPAVRYIIGSVTIHYSVIASSAQMKLDLMSSLQTDSVVQHGNRLPYTHLNDVITVDFPTLPAVRAIDSITVYYKGIPANTGFGSFILSQHGPGVPVLWTLSEPYGSRDWWPCKNGLDDKADSMDIYITHPASYRAASNGVLISEIPSTNNTITTHWHHTYPIASYLVCMAITDYQTFTRYVDLNGYSLPLVTYCYPEDQSNFEQGTPNTLQALQLFNNKVAPYPFMREKYGHVQFGWGGGMEHQTCSFIVNVDEGLTAHELAHQWFGDLVTCGSWQDIWLNEGFATFMARYFIESKYPEQAANRRQAVVENITSQPNGSVRVNDTSDLWRIFDGRLSYNKGSYLLEMLRFVLGEEVFFNAIRRYLQQAQLTNSFANTYQLKKEFELASGKKLDDFFTEWYEGEGYPTFHVAWESLSNQYVKYKIRQTTSDPSVAFYHLSVPLLFKNATHQKMITRELNSNDALFTDELGFVPDTVIVDPEYRLISANNTSKKIVFASSGVADVEVYPNPVVLDRLNVFFHDFTDQQAELVLMNAHGQVMLHQSINLLQGRGQLQLEMNVYPKGVYFLQINTANKRLAKKIIK